MGLLVSASKLTLASAPCADSFQNVVELLDDLFQRAAAAAEPEDQNYIRWALCF